MSKKIALILAINFQIFSGFSAVQAQSDTELQVQSTEVEATEAQAIEVPVLDSQQLPDQKVIVTDESNQESKIIKEDKYKGLPKSGVLSGTYSLGGESKNVSGPWGNEEAVANTNSPITGSVSKISAKQWKAVVFNNTEDDFSVSVKVKQIDARNKSVKTDSFSFRLKPKSSDERIISSATSAISAELELVSWKKL